MSEREKLIELLKNTCSCINEECKKCGCGDKCFTYKEADYLLKNNVKPLPCKINDIVYGISRGKIIPIQIDTIQYTSKGVNILGRNEQYYGNSTITLDVNNVIGMEWYYTKEEAENALKGGGKV